MKFRSSALLAASAITLLLLQTAASLAQAASAPAEKRMRAARTEIYVCGTEQITYQNMPCSAAIRTAPAPRVSEKEREEFLARIPDSSLASGGVYLDGATVFTPAYPGSGYATWIYPPTYYYPHYRAPRPIVPHPYFPGRT
jgi:hypothetical protein